VNQGHTHPYDDAVAMVSGGGGGGGESQRRLKRLKKGGNVCTQLQRIHEVTTDNRGYNG
jgi:hypothetical protein